MAGTSSADPLRSGRGHRPCHSAAPGSGPAGGPKPPASARPAPGGRFPPAGSGAGLRFSRTCRSGCHRAARAGETRVAFPVPARNGEGTVNASMAGAIAPATAATLPLASRGPKPPASARPAPGGRFSPAGSGAGLRSSRTCRSGWHRAARAGKRGAFPDPAQSGVPAHFGMPGLSGRGHRPCHCAAPGSGPAGGQSPRPAPAPPLAGASRPPGRALAFRGAWTDRSTGNRAARAGETRLAFPDPAQRGVLRDARSLWPGPSPLP
jgi:hypothetical protein